MRVFNFQPLAVKISSKKDKDGNQSRELEIEPEDLIALAAFCVAVITTLGLVFGKVHDATAIKIIAPCVGAGGISEAWKYVKRWLNKRKGV